MYLPAELEDSHHHSDHHDDHHDEHHDDHHHDHGVFDYVKDDSGSWAFFWSDPGFLPYDKDVYGHEPHGYLVHSDVIFNGTGSRPATYFIAFRPKIAL